MVPIGWQATPYLSASSSVHGRGRRRLNTLKPSTELTVQRFIPKRQQKVEAPDAEFDPESVKETIRELMWKNVGILREDIDLETTLDALVALQYTRFGNRIEEFEVQNMLDVAKLVTEAAMIRTESRGAHYRRDFPERDDTQLTKGEKRIVLCRNQQPKVVP